MSPRSRFVVLLVLSALAGSYGQTGQTGETEGPTTAETDPTTAGPVPSTTSTAPAPAPAVPTSIPNKAPAKGSWNVTTKDRTCIQSMMGLRIGFTYTDKDNKTHDISYDVPAAANETTTEGSDCGASSTADETLAIGFFGDKADAWKLTLTFKYDGSKKNWAATDVSLKFVMNSTFFPNVTGSKEYTVSLVNQTLFQTANSSSYQCVSSATLKDFKGADNPPTVNITTAELRVEAFREIAGDFSTAVPCPADTEVSNIVPIAVGAALAALVVIVLIAYLIGRKKNKRGYESV